MARPPRIEGQVRGLQGCRAAGLRRMVNPFVPRVATELSQAHDVVLAAGDQLIVLKPTG